MKVGIFAISGIFAALLLVAGGISLAEDGGIGYIKKVERPAFVVRKGSRKAADIGDSIYMNDLLTTGKSGAMGVTFKDNSMISIGPDTEFVVDEFVFQPRQESLSFSSKMMRGTLFFVTGTIAKLAPKSVSVGTPAGTIGVRGTRFLVRIEGEQQ